jgi:hypothetical protein
MHNAISYELFKEAVKKLPNHYTFEEQITSFTWLDGKDIYQITVTGSTGTTQNAFSHIYTIPNFNEMVNVEGHMNNAVGSTIPSGFYNPQSGTVFSLSVSITGDVQTFHSGSAFNNMDVIATVWYTKLD